MELKPGEPDELAAAIARADSAVYAFTGRGPEASRGALSPRTDER